jgi:hypothetical protein
MPLTFTSVNIDHMTNLTNVISKIEISYDPDHADDHC